MENTGNALFTKKEIKKYKQEYNLDSNFILSSINEIEDVLNKSGLNNAKISYIRFIVKTIKDLLSDKLSGEDKISDISMFVAWNYDALLSTLYKINSQLPDNNKISDKSFICLSLLKDIGDMYLSYPISISITEIILFLAVFSGVIFGIAALVSHFIS